MPCTYLVMYGSGFSAREKLFFALAWSPKARPYRLTCPPMGVMGAAYLLQPALCLPMQIRALSLILLGNYYTFHGERLGPSTFVCRGFCTIFW